MKSHVITTLLILFFIIVLVFFPTQFGYFCVAVIAGSLIGLLYWFAYQCVDGLFKK